MCSSMGITDLDLRFRVYEHASRDFLSDSDVIGFLIWICGSCGVYGDLQYVTDAYGEAAGVRWRLVICRRMGLRRIVISMV